MGVFPAWLEVAQAKLFLQGRDHLFARCSKPGELLELAKCLMRQHDMPSHGEVAIRGGAGGERRRPRVIDHIEHWGVGKLEAIIL